ncbi:MAG: hypothetical protein KAI99_14815, partial [Cyclobacteriaceae bacterium]|nr:hypothetical protein [Cyclobacteriaceae bacterium]
MRRGIIFIITCVVWFLSCTRHSQPKILTEDFSGIPEGRLIEYANARFVWKGENGSAEITKKKSKFTPNSLRINGGENKTVIVEPGEDIGTHELITFWAERWTRREPFEFRVSGFNNNEWKEIFNGDEAIKTGRFPSFVEIPLNGTSYSKYKFTCSSPENTGMFIDEFKLFNNAPITLDSISIRHVE